MPKAVYHKENLESVTIQKSTQELLQYILQKDITRCSSKTCLFLKMLWLYKVVTVQLG